MSMKVQNKFQRRHRADRWRRSPLVAMVLALAGMMPGAVLAQGSQQVVPMAAPAVDPHVALSAALTRLGRNPRDIEALQQAGEAALSLGDVPAATGFLSRADRLLPYNPRIMASLASARLRAQDPVTAIGLFDEAERSGPLAGDQIADRGLAYDLVSDNVTAQRYYRQALATGAGDEAVRRLALSLAIMGDRRAVEMALAPLLQKQDRAAWRIRAFAFAIMGREEEAVSIANATMPPDLATAMAPYLRFMRKLTPAQQAAAANLGFFPQASQMGVDTPRIAEWVANHGLKRMAVAEQPAPTPEQPKLAAAETGKDKRKGRARAKDAELPPVAASPAVPPPDPRPSREAVPAVPVELAAREAAPRHITPPPPKVEATRVEFAHADAARPVAVPAPAPISAPTPATPPAPAPARVEPAAAEPAKVEAPRPEPVRADPPPPVRSEPAPPASQPPVSQPPAPEASQEAAPPPPVREPAPAPHEPAPAPREAAPREAVARPAHHPAKKASFADSFSDFGKANTAATPASGAVDIRKINAPRPVPKAPPPPPPPKHPSRIWVQLGVGREESRIAFDWRKLTREEPELMKGHKPFTTEWVKTNRVLTGPFDTEAEAKAFNEKLHKAGHADSHVWISPDGQAVDPLGG